MLRGITSVSCQKWKGTDQSSSLASASVRLTGFTESLRRTSPRTLAEMTCRVNPGSPYFSIQCWLLRRHEGEERQLLHSFVLLGEKGRTRRSSGSGRQRPRGTNENQVRRTRRLRGAGGTRCSPNRIYERNKKVNSVSDTVKGRREGQETHPREGMPVELANFTSNSSVEYSGLARG